MNGLWKKRVPAFLLTLVMIVSLMPAALADDPDPNNPDPAPPATGDHTHTASSGYSYDETGHWFACTYPGCSEKISFAAHAPGSWKSTGDTRHERTPDSAGAQMEEQIREKEGRRILERLQEDAYICTLEIGGKRLSSEGLARWMEKLTVGGTSHVMFVIGGSLGLHESVSRRADFCLSFSDMTFPHQLMRVILTEQIYRAFRIIHGEPYHK